MNKIIELSENKDKIVNMDLYTYIGIKHNCRENFVVCHVTEDEYEMLSNCITMGVQLPERIPGLVSYGYNRNRYMMLSNIAEGVIELSNYDDPKGETRYFIENGELKCDENTRSFIHSRGKSVGFGGLRIYTTETFQNVIEHYCPKELAVNEDIVNEDIKFKLGVCATRKHVLEERKKVLEQMALIKEYYSIVTELQMVEAYHRQLAEIYYREKGFRIPSVEESIDKEHSEKIYQI